MTQVLIVGDRESGKATFLTLLYAASVKSGSDKEDEFRFHAPIESMDTASLLFQQLMAGHFPDAVTKQGIQDLTLRIGAGRGKGGLLSRLRGRASPEVQSELRFTRLGALDEELPQMLKGSVASIGGWRHILDSDVVTVLVDSTKLAGSVEAGARSPMSEYDALVEQLLSAIQRLRQRVDRILIYPIFVFTKFDAASPEVLRKAGLAIEPPGVEDRGRDDYAEVLLGSIMPRTFALVTSRDLDGVRFARPAYFFSWVRTEAGASGNAQRIRLRRTPISGWEPEFPKEEYLAYLECVGEAVSAVE